MAQVIYRKDYRPYPFEVEHCHLAFDIFADHVIVRSEIRLRQNPRFLAAYPAENCVLNGEGLEILELKLDGETLAEGSGYRFGQNRLELLHSAEKTELTFAAEVRINPYNNKSLEGMYRSGQILCSQNEATGFRHITFYPDRPDVMSYFVTEITADKAQYPRLLSNGNLLEKKDLAEGRHYARWEDPFPKPAYLYAIVAGDLDLLSDRFQTCSGRRVALEIYTDKGKSEKARFAMESLKQAMKWDEQRFGREYDLDLFMIVAVDSFNFGAMENKGLNIFNSSLVFATEESATDETYERIASVIAHEYFHNWTGNRITCRDWFQVTLKEGLTVYRDELFSEDHFGREVCRIAQIDNLRNNQYPEDAGPNRSPIRPDSFIDINNFYTQTIYEKGAAVIRMMASYLGEQGFHKGIDCYFERFDGQAVTCDDFVDAIEEGSKAAGQGKDLSALRRWYEQAGTPQLYVRSEWDGQNFVLHLRQENPNAAVSGSGQSAQDFPPLAFPLPLALYHSDGELLLQDSVLVKQREMQLSYPLAPESAPKSPTGKKPIPSLLLDHISPLEVHYDYSEEELLLLVTADRDPFNRYEAMQKYLQNLLLGLRPGQPVSLAPEFSELLRCWLQQHSAASGRAAETLSPSYFASLLSVPGLEILAESQNPPQYQSLHLLREAFCRELASQLESEMLACYQTLTQAHYVRDEQAVGKRRLRNTLLRYLCRLEKQEYYELAYQQYQNCDNMTDSYAALQALTYWPDSPASSSAGRSKAALEHFCQRWQGNFLILCRWFALQASVPRPETLEVVRQLEQHPLFQKGNPNMLRSLYAVLGRNLSVFHEKSGSAYDFLAQRILQIDSFNSMMAAGLAKCYVAYKKLDNESQQLMGKALQQIAQREGISDRLYEIVSKTLQS